MPVLLVLCHFEDSLRLEPAFKEYGEVFRLSASNYLIHTRRQHDEVLNNLSRLVGLAHPDSLFVIEVRQRRIGPTTSEVNSWLRGMAEKDLAEDRDDDVRELKPNR